MNKIRSALRGASAYFSVCVLLVITAACASYDDKSASKPVAQTTTAIASAAKTFGNGPAMWRLADEDTEIFLFGTFHLLPAGQEWITSDFTQAMQETEITITEADTTSPEAVQALQAAVQKYGLNPPGVTLSSQLGPELAAEFAEVAQQYGLSMAQLEPIRPWLAGLTLTQIAFQQSGFNPESGADMVITARAKNEGDEIRHFETAEFQIKMLASLDDLGETAGTADTLEQLQDFSGFADKMYSAWKTGDVEFMTTELIENTRAQSEPVFNTIFKQRNANWVIEIDEMMAGSGDYFIAVGVGHLVGDDSVVDMLQERGFSVERVQ